MKLVMTLLVRDERDVVRANIEFHLSRGVDFIIATDNLSIDGVTDILREYEQRGLLHYIQQTDDNYSQHRWVTEMARLACTRFGADWVINNDADEFWWTEQGDLRLVLSGMPPSCIAAAAERTNFVPRPMADGEFFADVMTVREQRSLNALGAPLPGKVCHRAFRDIEVAQGNHEVYRNGDTMPAIAAPITILHFPMRSYQQFANKIAKGGAALARNAHLDPQIAAAWRRLYEIWQRGELEPYFRAQILDDAAIKLGLEAGRLLFDDRLKLALSKLRSGPSEPSLQL